MEDVVKRIISTAMENNIHPKKLIEICESVTEYIMDRLRQNIEDVIDDIYDEVLGELERLGIPF